MLQRYRILTLVVELIFFFLQEEHLLKCATAELPSRHKRRGTHAEEDAEEEVTACSIKAFAEHTLRASGGNHKFVCFIVLKLGSKISISDIRKEKAALGLPLG